MIYITGDTHGTNDFGKLSTSRFPEQKNMTKNDSLIICGDWGGVWYGSPKDNYLINWYNDKPFTTIIVLGNHENYDAIEKYPVVSFHGSPAYKISDSIFCLHRGYIYNIEDKKFFAFGGAQSTDAEWRIEGESWWKQELPSNEDYNISKQTLKNNPCVDYIITHAAPTSIQSFLSIYDYSNKLTNYLEDVKNNVQFQHWYFGHYHTDAILNDKYTCLYNKIRRIV
jgi:hypothetical protein